MHNNITRTSTYLQIDFSEAFDTINHSKLIQIMTDLGYPARAVQVVKDLYTNATTSVRTPYGCTPPINIHRGTIQGDSLSPYLFIVYMEPLLRWLRVGGRGYKFASLPGYDKQIQHQTSDCTYADDLNILSNNVKDLAIQAHKVTSYANWANLSVNIDKSSATAALYQQQPYDPYDATTIQRQVVSHIQIQGQPVRFQAPKHAFKYLGIFMTMDLNWRPQYEHTLELLKTKIQHLLSSWLSRHQKKRVLTQCLRPMVTYTFYAAPFTQKQIAKLDSLLTQASKVIYGLGRCVSSAMAHEDITKGGLGCPSLMVEYHTILIQRLVRSLRSTSTHGVISTAVLQSQLKHVNDIHTIPVRRTAMTGKYLRLKQLMALQTSGLLLKDGTIDITIDTLPSEMPAKVTAQLLTPAIAKSAVQCCPRLISDVMTLSELNICSLDHIINIHTHCVIPASALKSIHTLPQGQKATTKHQTALNRITLFMHTASIAAIEAAATEAKHFPYGNSSIDHKDLPPAVRRPSIDFIMLLRDAATRSKEPPALTALNQLLEQHEQQQTDACTHRGKTLNISVAGRKQKSDTDTSIRHADVRVRLGDDTERPTCDNVRHTTYKRSDTCRTKQTAKDIYDTLPKGKHRLHGVNDAWRDVRLQLLNEVVGEQDNITDILHVRHTTEITPASDGGANAKDTQRQAYVQWANTIAPAWTVELAAQLGYHTASTEPLTDPEDLVANTPQTCEYCVLRQADDDAPMPANSDECICDCCLRMFHKQCLTICELERWREVENTDRPYHCQECVRYSYVTDGLPPALQWVTARWMPRYEPVQNLHDMLDEELQRKLQRLLKKRSVDSPPAAHAKVDTATDDRYAALALSNAEQQGIYPQSASQEQLYDISHGQHIRSLLRVHLDPINPHFDIHATGHYEVMIRTVPTDDTINHSHSDASPPLLACVYRPTGQGMYALPVERLKYLYSRYNATKNQKPDLFHKLHAASFEEELYRLLVRQQLNTDQKHHWSVPANVYAVLHQHTHSTKERFANPLNSFFNHAQCWSEQARDKLFGFKTNAYKYTWSGVSLASPPSRNLLTQCKRWHTP